MRIPSAVVPTLSVFYGIVIKMFFDDHDPPHLHVEYAGQEAKVGLAGSELMRGVIPPRALRLVREWIILHRDELEENWRLAKAMQPVRRVEPLP